MATREIDLIAQKTWHVTSDESRHPEMDGETVGINEPFSNGCMFPGDPKNINESAGCQCYMTVDVPGLDRHAHSEQFGVLDFTDYDDNEQEAIRTFMDPDANAHINKVLRNGRKYNGRYDVNGERPWDYLDGAVAKGSAKEELILYRGLKLQTPWKIGDEVIDRGFASTSTQRTAAEDFTKFIRKRDKGTVWVLEIHVPPGTPGLAIPGGKMSLNEVILPRNSRFEVIGVKGNSIQVRWLGMVDEGLSTKSLELLVELKQWTI